MDRPATLFEVSLLLGFPEAPGNLTLSGVAMTFPSMLIPYRKLSAADVQGELDHSVAKDSFSPCSIRHLSLLVI